MPFAPARYLPRVAFMDARTKQPTGAWERFFRDLQFVPLFLGRVEKNQQGAAIAATPVVVEGTLQPGVYRLTYYVRIERAATTSSELVVVFNWTDANVAQTRTGGTLNGNTTTTVEQAQFLVRVDKDTSITLETSYASVGATSMRFNIDLILEKVLGEAVLT